jgi:hypothetical protein
MRGSRSDGWRWGRRQGKPRASALSESQGLDRRRPASIFPEIVAPPPSFPKPHSIRNVECAFPGKPCMPVSPRLSAVRPKVAIRPFQPIETAFQAIATLAACPMHVNKVSYVRTIGRVAKELGEDVDWLYNVALEMEPEGGAVWVEGLGDDSRHSIQRVRRRKSRRAHQNPQGIDADQRALKSTTSDAPLRPTPDTYSASG